MLGRLWTCCRVVWIIVWTLVWFLIRAGVIPLAILFGLVIAGPVGFLEWLTFGSRRVWDLWADFSEAAGKLIPEL